MKLASFPTGPVDDSSWARAAAAGVASATPGETALLLVALGAGLAGVGRSAWAKVLTEAMRGRVVTAAESEACRLWLNTCRDALDLAEVVG
jgi:hypothetical protein